MISLIEIKYLCPTIAMISAGKTTILNVLFNIDFLESSSGIGTKFVNIIRYNPDVGNYPKFYHLKLKLKENGDYDFYKEESTEIFGKEEIKCKIKELNEEFKKKEVPYEELFYMIEVGENNFIEDKEYLKNYDLVDIPGVSEYNKSSKRKEEKNLKKCCTIEEEMKDYNPGDEQNYLTEIFKRIKNKMINGIIIFSIDNYQLVENYRIIGKLQKVINKPIENFLILLNKIDKSENIEYDVSNLRSKIMEYFPSANEFNFTKNTIVPCSAIQLENELKMDKNFKNLIYFHYLNFLMKCKNSSLINNYNFIDFLKKLISKEKITIKKFLKKMHEIINDININEILNDIKGIISYIILSHQDENINMGLSEYDINKTEIQKNLEKIENNKEEIQDEEEEQEEEEDFNLNNVSENLIILYYFYEFNNKKLIPSKTRNTMKIINYFSLQKVYEYNIKKNIKDSFINDNSYEFINVPLLGLSNAGKSTIFQFNWLQFITLS